MCASTMTERRKKVSAFICKRVTKCVVLFKLNSEIGCTMTIIHSKRLTQSDTNNIGEAPELGIYLEL